MREQFMGQLKELHEKMIQMGNLCEEAISAAAASLMERNPEQRNKAYQSDEQIDALERKIENLCLQLLLQQQPVAKDLRVISSALKMISDMERIGDQAADIAELALLADGTPLTVLQQGDTWCKVRWEAQQLEGYCETRYLILTEGSTT